MTPPRYSNLNHYLRAVGTPVKFGWSKLRRRISRVVAPQGHEALGGWNISLRIHDELSPRVLIDSWPDAVFRCVFATR